MSILGNKWVVRERAIGDLMTAGLDDETVRFHDPFLFRDMKQAVDRLQQAIQSGERVLVFGDYDVDGISGTAILVHTLRELGANVSYRLPTRQDGYGINPKWIDQFIALDIKILITVDCGISNFKEIQDATAGGMDVIITDHHAIPKRIPPAYALLHPNLPDDTYPFHDLSGSAMAYKLAVGVMGYMRGEESAREWKFKLADLASLGTVADCVPLVGENRWIVKTGLDQMRQTNWEGLNVLLKNAGVTEINGYDSDLIGFRLGPRINAAGRLETPTISLQVLLNENGAAARLAQKLEELNGDRRDRVEGAVEEAEVQIIARNLLENRVIVAWSQEWPAGIIGLIAARLSEKYHRPAIVLEDRGHEMVASCRSPEFFNVVHALTVCSDRLKAFGGHAGAAGFTIEPDQMDLFVEELEQHAVAVIHPEDMIPVINIDYELKLADITVELATTLASFEPYGAGNARPRFLLRNIAPLDLQTVGQEHRHLRFQVQGTGKEKFSAIAFRFGDHYTALQQVLTQDKKLMDVVFELERNVWNGRERIQLKVVDLGISN